MSYKFTLNGTVIADQPKGWDKAVINAKADKVIRGLFIVYTTKLEFWGDGFDIIDAALEENFCNEIDILIEEDECDPGTFTTVFEGLLQLPEIEYDVDACMISGRLVDIGYNAKIMNNKGLQATVSVPRSKNDVTITAAPVVSIGFYNPVDGVGFYAFPGRECFRVFECFRMLIEYMTDGEIGFESTLFDTGGDQEDLVIVTGEELRLPAAGSEAPRISFKQLFEEMDKKFNLGFAIEPDGAGGFQVRIEETSYFQSQASDIRLENVRGLTYKLDKDDLYANVEIGSDIFDTALGLSYPPVHIRAFRTENYTVLGTCNTDKTLNLVSKCFSLT